MRVTFPVLALFLLTGPALAQDPARPSETTPPPPMSKPMEPQALETQPADQQATPQIIGVTAGDWRASKLIGASVLNPQDRAIGEIEDVILDNDGKVVSVLVSVGGFLGLGEKNVAVTFKDLTMSQSEDGDTIVRTSLSQQALETAPNVVTD
jgi:sporulation protein YlmC with PRC-barrel domain